MMYMEHSALLQEFLHPPKASWATADPSTAGLIPVVPRSTRSIHDEHCSDPCCGSMIAKLQGDLSWMLAVHVGSGSKNGLALLFGVGGSGSRNGLALDEASACVELDAVPGALCASSSALRFLAAWLCFSLRSRFLTTSGRFFS